MTCTGVDQVNRFSWRWFQCAVVFCWKHVHVFSFASAGIELCNKPVPVNGPSMSVCSARLNKFIGDTWALFKRQLENCRHLASFDDLIWM